MVFTQVTTHKMREVKINTDGVNRAGGGGRRGPGLRSRGGAGLGVPGVGQAGPSPLSCPPPPSCAPHGHPSPTPPRRLCSGIGSQAPSRGTAWPLHPAPALEMPPGATDPQIPRQSRLLSKRFWQGGMKRALGRLAPGQGHLQQRWAGWAWGGRSCPPVRAAMAHGGQRCLAAIAPALWAPALPPKMGGSLV